MDDEKREEIVVENGVDEADHGDGARHELDTEPWSGRHSVRFLAGLALSILINIAIPMMILPFDLSTVLVVYVCSLLFWALVLFNSPKATTRAFSRGYGAGFTLVVVGLFLLVGTCFNKLGQM